MKTSIFTIPDDSTKWWSWTEDRLIADDLIDSVVELEVVQGEREPSEATLQTVF